MYIALRDYANIWVVRHFMFQSVTWTSFRQTQTITIKLRNYELFENIQFIERIISRRLGFVRLLDDAY